MAYIFRPFFDHSGKYTTSTEEGVIPAALPSTGMTLPKPAPNDSLLESQNAMRNRFPISTPPTISVLLNRSTAPSSSTKRLMPPSPPSSECHAEPESLFGMRQML